MKILYNQQQIKDVVLKLSQEIESKHKNNLEPPIMICVLNGAFMFFTDLIRNINIDIEIDFIQIKSYYGQEQKEIQILKHLNLDYSRRDVYIVDDIYDSGNTIEYIIEYLNQDNAEFDLTPKSITPVVLFKKKKKEFYGLFGFEIENDNWIFGYGMDDERGLMRNKEVIFGLTPEVS